MEEYIISNLKKVFDDNKNPVISKEYVKENFVHKDLIRIIRDKFEWEDYYGFEDVLNDLNKILEDK